jgi:hypothetical protein
MYGGVEWNTGFFEIGDLKLIAERKARARAQWENVFMVQPEGVEPEWDGPHMKMIGHIYVPATGKWYVADRLLTTREMLGVTPELVLKRLKPAPPAPPRPPKPPVQAEPETPPAPAPRQYTYGEGFALAVVFFLAMMLLRATV